MGGKFTGDLAKEFRLFFHALRRAVEFQQEQCFFRQGEVGILIASFDLKRIKQFNPRHRNPILDGHDHRVTRRLNRWEGTNPASDFIRDALQF